MEQADAIKMIANDHLVSPHTQQWADLGCGNGTFTLALASLLKLGSMINAVDRSVQALNHLPGQYNGVSIKKTNADIDQQPLPLKNMDGILMANSLHYIKDKFSFIQKAGSWLREDGCFLIVEYDMNQPNQWVPYPLNFSSLKELFYVSGFTNTTKLQERSSLFRRAKLYSVIIRR